WANVQLRGGVVEIDVAALRETGWEEPSGPERWTPPAATGTGVIDFTGLETFEVKVIYDNGDAELIAALELVSPANKDRPANRRAFALKCANYLEQGTSVIIVDVVTGRSRSLHEELLSILELNSTEILSTESSLSAIAYRSLRENAHTNIEWCAQMLVVGKAMPKVPMWIGTDVSVPVDLEATYMKTFEYIRVPSPSAERNGT
ncbi:MAG TPA: hypothetical protein VHR66_11555, partial [Gemmataceae bacterium]|nr:hypothetical protein [Gemmataceae bacterium]